MVPYLRIFAHGAALWWFSTYQNHLISRLSNQNWTRHICKVKKTERNCCCPHCRCHHLGYSVPSAQHRAIWCRSTFGPRGPGLSNPTSFPRPALPMAPTTDNNVRDERNFLRPNPVTFLRDFTPHMTTNNVIIRKRCLNHNACVNKKMKFLHSPVSPNFCARRSVKIILNLSESLDKPLVIAKLNSTYLSSVKSRAKLMLSSLPVSPSRVLRAPQQITVPFGSVAPSGHAAQAWAIPPPL